MIIDCHTHLNRYGDGEPGTLHERYLALREEMDRNDVSYALVLSSYRISADRPGVPEILEAIGDDPRLGVVAGVSFEGYRSSDLADLRELLRARRVKALKLYPGYEPFYPHNSRMRVIYELAAEFRVPVMIHSGDTYSPRGKVKYAHPLQVDEVAVDFPEVTFVICHLGNPWLVDAMEVIYKNENVVGDISGFTIRHFEERFERYMVQRIRDVIAYAGEPQSLLYGTDWPICEMGSYIRFVRQLELTPDETELILWRNTARIFDLDLQSLERPGQAEHANAAEQAPR